MDKRSLFQKMVQFTCNTIKELQCIAFQGESMRQQISDAAAAKIAGIRESSQVVDLDEIARSNNLIFLFDTLDVAASEPEKFKDILNCIALTHHQNCNSDTGATNNTVTDA